MCVCTCCRGTGEREREKEKKRVEELAGKLDTKQVNANAREKSGNA